MSDSDSKAAISEPALYSHLDAPAQRLAHAPDHIRIESIGKDRLIYHPRFVTLVNEGLWLAADPPTSRARGLIYFGPPGSGKSTLSTTIASHVAQWFQREQAHQPTVLIVSMSGLRSAKMVFERALKNCNVPMSKRFSTSEAEMILHDTLRKMNCRLLILDELQDVLGSNRSEQQRVLEVIKHMMNELKLPILGLGTEAAREGFGTDAHLAARFKALPLPTWKADDDFANFLAAYERSLPLRKPSNLSHPDVMRHLLAAGSGILDEMLKIIKPAAINAIASKKERITLADLKQGQLRPSIEILRVSSD